MNQDFEEPGFNNDYTHNFIMDSDDIASSGEPTLTSFNLHQSFDVKNEDDTFNFEQMQNYSSGSKLQQQQQQQQQQLDSNLQNKEQESTQIPQLSIGRLDKSKSRQSRQISQSMPIQMHSNRQLSRKQQEQQKTDSDDNDSDIEDQFNQKIPIHSIIESQIKKNTLEFRHNGSPHKSKLQDINKRDDIFRVLDGFEGNQTQTYGGFSRFGQLEGFPDDTE